MKKFILLLIISVYGICGFAQKEKAMLVQCTPSLGQFCASADCFFSSACACFPDSWAGGCGCWWGVATCHGSKDKTIQHPKFYFDRFEKFLTDLENQKIKQQEIKAAYYDLKKASGEIKEGYFPVDEGNFDLFMKKYTAFIESLSKDEQNFVTKYIKDREVQVIK